MDQRREPRFPLDRPVQVTVLDAPNRSISAHIQNASGRGIALATATPLSIGTPLKIELEDSFLLGEVIYSRREGERWFAGVELEHALFGLAELASSLREYEEDRPIAAGGFPGRRARSTR